MPLIHLDTVPMLILIFVLCPLIQVSGALIGRKVPYNKLEKDRWLYRTRKWEKGGAIYRKVLIHRWKNFLPDGAKFFKGDFTKKHMLSYDSVYLDKFVRESCRAELVHWLGMVPFVLFFLLVPPLVAGMLVLYAVIVNLPCIIAQRYNRPRLSFLCQAVYKREQKKSILADIDDTDISKKYVS